ncbi:DNA excision repair protein ERCC-8 [Thecamonas trahens ATCC 50062]|uniref:DNA excision repair protein ERCC-8 n=1 Tax=Thecamonas trahens ATCC 50062 TaxID=461836 RepID=A0A0L0DS99_THETB|nr:DNA excision repair protein ERCC-8 [Thecamonas trahens ATCC 50062]KNC55145.1 DNA excision repair protein ERCC-8 [Thecamonas trahens ATCC 50062]|eukprot:XP_013753202.1 DNA excision repair protein ERCC-8 [Thecamonas trahens ATCC 50062]
MEDVVKVAWSGRVGARQLRKVMEGAVWRELALVETKTGGLELVAVDGEPEKPVVVGRARARAPLLDVKFYPRDAGMFLSADAKGEVALFDTANMVVATQFRLGSGSAAHSLALPDCSAAAPLVAVGSGTGEVRLIDLRSGGFTHSMPNHADVVTSLAFGSGDASVLVSGSADGSICIYDIRRAGRLMTLDLALTSESGSAGPLDLPPGYVAGLAHHHGVSSLVMASNGACLYSAGRDGAIRQWDMASGANTLLNFGTFGGSLTLNSVPGTLALSPGDDVLYYPVARHGIGVFETSTGEHIDTLSAHFATITGLTTLAFNHILVSASTAGAVLLWAVPPPSPDAPDDLARLGWAPEDVDSDDSDWDAL